ncbi:hypothetical protein ACPWT1_03930 [Ramlibacter sp. MMS24-I3-19]|uniref:hypothetical protein n=1 Tax=Ramlibacter sp. MMS24-I3-19 TaxID=3416606 RepID=UPI003D06D372
MNDVTLHLSRRELAHWLALLALGDEHGCVLVLTPFEACGFAVIPAELKEDGDILLMDWSCPQVRDLRARFGHYSAASFATRLQQGEFMEGLCALVDKAAALAGYAVIWC